MKIIKVNDHLSIGPQPSTADLAELCAQGFTSVINNRCEGEEPAQPNAADSAAAAKAAGLGFVHQPVTMSTITADDVRALASGRNAMAASEDAGFERGDAFLASPREGNLAARGHTGKYAPLWRWLRDQEARTVDMTFSEVEEVLGFPLPTSCRQHIPHWHSYDGSAVARAIGDAGWRASRVHLADETLTFVRGG